MGLLVGNGVLKLSHKIEPNITSSSFTLFICGVTSEYAPLSGAFFFSSKETGVRKEQ